MTKVTTTAYVYDTVDEATLDQACEACGAEAGEDCTTPKGKPTGYHKPRRVEGQRAFDESQEIAADPETKPASNGAAKYKVARGVLADQIGVHIPVSDGECGCGCGADITPRIRGFKPGHDAKLKSKLLGAGIDWRTGEKVSA